MNQAATRWLIQATDDLNTAVILFDSRRHGPCAFFCQQAAEKGLKAMLYQVGERPWGHSVSSLLDQICAVYGIDPANTPQAEAQALDEHYMRPRYPAIPNVAPIQPQGAQRTQRNGRSDANWQLLCALCDLCGQKLGHIWNCCTLP